MLEGNKKESKERNYLRGMEGRKKAKKEGDKIQYNTWYKTIKKEIVPKYLKKEWREGR